MNYTQNYRLPQWEKSDRILMDDFNQMCQKIEAGIDEAAAAAELNAAAVANRAQSTADSALSAANAAQSTANKAFSPSYMPFVAGSYTGNGETTTLNLGFKPSFAIITAQYSATGLDSEYMNNSALVGPAGNMSNMVKFLSTGMSVAASNPSSTLLNLNRVGTNYSYIAFR